MSTYQSPDDDLVQAALRRLTTYQLRRVFYEGLKNPDWVRPLATAGAFRSPPEPEPLADGRIRELFWPEIAYLIAVAEQAPHEVVDVLLTLEASTNSWVRRAVFTVGSRIPADQAARLKPLIDAWGTGFGWRTDPRDLASFAVNLLSGGHTKFGVSFANLLFRPHEGAVDGREPATGLDEHWYSTELPRVVHALGAKALRTVLPWLVEYERLRNDSGSDFDNSGFGRSLIANRANSYHAVHDAIIDAVRDAAIERLANDPAGAWNLLSRHKIVIVRRIALYALTDVLSLTVSRGDDLASLLLIARELLTDVKCRDSHALVEFVNLARTVASTAPAELAVLQPVIAEGPFSTNDIDRMSSNMRDRGREAGEVTSDIHRWAENWRHQVLAGIGRDLLPPALQQELDRLDTAHGVRAGSISPPFELTSWSGPNSPISLEEMAAMSPTELVSHLASWHDDSVGIGPEPSHEGQARVLTDLLTSEPLALVGVPGLAELLRPTYLRAVLGGWEAAYKADRDLDWQSVVATVKDVLRHDDASLYPPEGGQFDDDPDFRGAKQAAIGLIEDLVKPKSTHAVPEDTVAELAGLLIESTSDERPWQEYSDASDAESGMDPLTTSLNWRWPEVVRGLINLIAHGDDAPWYSSALDALDRELARPDERGASRAAVGEGLGKLFNHAPDWLGRRRDQMFGSRDGTTRSQQIAMTTAIAVHFYHPALYALLSDSMIAAVNAGTDVAVGWGNQTSPVERIGQWVVEGVIRADVRPDDPLRSTFYSVAPPDIRGKAIGHIAWGFMHAESVDEVIRDRLADLWDERVRHVRENPEDHAELDEFYWFARSEKFPGSWWLPRLIEVLKLDDQFSPRGMIGEQLAAASKLMPRPALDALVLLMKADENADIDSYDLRQHALAPVIAAGLDSHDAQLATDATAFMNEMGSRGEIDLERRVQALRGES